MFWNMRVSGRIRKSPPKTPSQTFQIRFLLFEIAVDCSKFLLAVSGFEWPQDKGMPTLLAISFPHNKLRMPTHVSFVGGLWAYRYLPTGMTFIKRFLVTLTRSDASPQSIPKTVQVSTVHLRVDKVNSERLKSYKDRLKEVGPLLSNAPQVRLRRFLSRPHLPRFSNFGRICKISSKNTISGVQIRFLPFQIAVGCSKFSFAMNGFEWPQDKGYAIICRISLFYNDIC